jgi:uncharacterized metal-binding protein YceD (DUF177 family)
MGKLDTYKVDLKGMQEEVQCYEYLLDSRFFIDIGGDQVENGRVHVRLKVTRRKGFFDFVFVLSGIAVVPCDRCLEEMDFPVETTAHLIVKFGKDYAEESDEIVVIPESDRTFYLAWFLYEFVVLAIPIKHVHGPGKCDRQMASKLKNHLTQSENDDDPVDADPDERLNPDDGHIDPRWNALKGFSVNE